MILCGVWRLWLLPVVLAWCATAPAVGDFIPDPPPGIQYVLETDKDVYQLGENVHATQKVVNPTPWELTLELKMMPGFDLWVLDDGEKIWSEHTDFFMYGSRVIVGPGETLRRDYVWDMRDSNGELVLSGDYEIKSVIYGAGENVSKTIAIVPEPAAFGIMLFNVVVLLRKRSQLCIHLRAERAAVSQ
jgi:hypothetical protein